MLSLNTKSALQEFEAMAVLRCAITCPNYNAVNFKNIIDPDILIRTGNTQRLSNFMLWQLAYTEIFFEKKLWPDFKVSDFKKILNRFKIIKRNYGSI